MLAARMVILTSGIIAILGTLPKHLVKSQQIVSLWAHGQKEEQPTA